jgi:hypothetical protein
MCRVGPVVEKETTLEVEQMNKVSMPSELFLDAGVDADRRLGRVASVNEPRAVVGTCGACSGIFEDAGTDIAGSLCAHFAICGEVGSPAGSLEERVLAAHERVFVGPLAGRSRGALPCARLAIE